MVSVLRRGIVHIATFPIQFEWISDAIDTHHIKPCNLQYLTSLLKNDHSDPRKLNSIGKMTVRMYCKMSDGFLPSSKNILKSVSNT